MEDSKQFLKKKLKLPYLTELVLILSLSLISGAYFKKKLANFVIKVKIHFHRSKES